MTREVKFVKRVQAAAGQSIHKDGSNDVDCVWNNLKQCLLQEAIVVVLLILL